MSAPPRAPSRSCSVPIRRGALKWQLCAATFLFWGCSAEPPSPDASALPSGTDPADAPLPEPESGCASGAAPAAKLWRLSDSQYSSAVADLLPGVEAEPVTTPGVNADHFVALADASPVGGSMATAFQLAARKTAAKAIQPERLQGILSCAPGQEPGACEQSFIERFAARAFRRPLAEEELAGLRALHALGTEPGEGVRLVISAVLQSPSFLYRTELGSVEAAATGEQQAPLTPYELASNVSFFLLGSIPDAELWQAAVDGSLANRAVLEQHVDRLLASARTLNHLTHVMLRWLGLGGGLRVELSKESYPEFDESLRASLHEETRLVVESLLSRGGTLHELLQSPRTFVNAKLAQHYGAAATLSGDPETFSEVELPTSERAEILTHGALIAKISPGNVVVHRGLFVLHNLVCGQIPPPPPELDIGAPPGAALTNRQFAEYRASNPSCAGCHAHIDPYGLAFERYDALGRYANPNADAAGVLSGTDIDGPFTDLVDLSRRLPESESVIDCFAKQFTSYAIGQAVPSLSSCGQAGIVEEWRTGGMKLRDLFRSIALSPALSVRNTAPQPTTEIRP